MSPRKLRLVALALGALLGGACAGDVAGPSGDGAGGGASGAGPGKPGPGGRGGSGGSPGTVGMIPGQPGTPAPTPGKDPGTPGVPPAEGKRADDLPTCGPGALSIRRLTRDEYDNTVRDLLGDDTRPARDFPADVGSLGFDNNAASLSIPPVLVEKLEIAADALVEATWKREASGTKRVRICEPVAPQDRDCASRILQKLATRAFRRPVAKEELDALLGLYDRSKQAGDLPEAAVKVAMKGVLMAPQFIFRIETAPAPGAPLDDFALASRLSYFLWGSMPDDPLYALAEKGMLRNDKTLRAQAERMLRDQRADGLVQRFAGQWLKLGDLEAFTPDPAVYPNVTQSLKQAMQGETLAFVKAFLREDLSALDMLDANFTYVNSELARHYGLSGGADHWPKTTFPANSPRAGLLTHASVLATTSLPDRTSVIHRGVFLLERFTCFEPPPPPPNVPPIPPAGPKARTGRERLEMHRANPACSGCHDIIDPMGFALEHFDVVGKYRDTEGGAPIDASGTFGGKTFRGARELATVLKADPAVPACLTRKLYSFALARTPGAADEAALKALNEGFAQKKHRLAALVADLVASPSFGTSCGGR
jgi:hypothetical protein